MPDPIEQVTKPATPPVSEKKTASEKKTVSDEKTLLPGEVQTEAQSALSELSAEEAESAKRTLPLWASVLVILAICVVSFWLAFNPEWVMGFGRWGYLGAFIISAVASATIILPAPGIALVIAMGASLDPIWLGVIAGIGSAFGELTGYVAGASGRAFVPEKQRYQFERLHDLTNRYGALLLFGLAAIPFPLFDFAGIISGMMRMNVLLFIVAVSLGKSIKYVIMILVGGSFIHWMQEFFFGLPPSF